jgi:hypothetical protein
MIRLHGGAPVFVVQDVVRSVAYYRDALGFRTSFCTPRASRGASRASRR